MILIDSIHDILRSILASSRYDHSLRVAYSALELASRWNEVGHKAYLAGLIHDAGKHLTHVDAVGRGIALPPESADLYDTYPSVWHALMGPFICKTLFEIDDQDILTAVQWHTTGIAQMSPLAEILFIADFIEPGRTGPECRWIREMAKHNRAQCVYAIASISINNISKKNKSIHPATSACQTYYKSQLSYLDYTNVDEILNKSSDAID